MNWRKGTFITILVMIIGFTVVLSSCQVPGNSTPAGTAEESITLAYDLMEQQDYDGAMQAFSDAMILDPSNGEALIGYSILNIASIGADETVSTVAGDNLGIVGYPTNMNDMISGSFLQEYTVDPYTYRAPEIVGQGSFDFNSDGVIDGSERMLAMFAYFTANNSGFNESVGPLLTMLKNRLSTAVTAIESIPDDQTFSFTWNMFSDTPWTYQDGSGNPLPFTIGKAELLAEVAMLEALEAEISLVAMYDLSIPDISAYYALLNVNDGTMFDPAATPVYPVSLFTSFGSLSADASTLMNEALTEYQSALMHLKDGANLVKADRTGLSISSSGFAESGVATPWSDFVTGLDFGSAIDQELFDSLQNGSTAYIPVNPVDVTEMASLLASWPTAANMDTGAGTLVYATNPGAYFSGGPVALLDLFETNGVNPRFYEISGNSMTEVSTAPDVSAAPFSSIAVKFKTSALNGLIPADSTDWVIDDPANYIETLSVDWDDGETIYWIEVYFPVQDGLIDMSQLDQYPNGDPTSVYENSYNNISQISDAVISGWLSTNGNGATATNFRDQATTDNASVSDGMGFIGGIFVGDTTNGDIYLLDQYVLPIHAALTLTSAGTAVTVETGAVPVSVDATGDFWQAIFAFQHALY